MSRAPLAGCRVVDLGIITAGASTSAMLADLGADVIKVEASAYIDPFRMWDKGLGAEDWWNKSRFFDFTNRNKRGLALDLKKPKGKELFLDLVANADVIVENFRRGVLERLRSRLRHALGAEPAARAGVRHEPGADRPRSQGGVFRLNAGSNVRTRGSDARCARRAPDQRHPAELSRSDRLAVRGGRSNAGRHGTAPHRARRVARHLPTGAGELPPRRAHPGGLGRRDASAGRHAGVASNQDGQIWRWALAAVSWGVVGKPLSSGGGAGARWAIHRKYRGADGGPCGTGRAGDRACATATICWRLSAAARRRWLSRKRRTAPTSKACHCRLPAHR